MSLVRHTEIDRLRHVWQDRVLADFRDFRFTWPGFRALDRHRGRGIPDRRRSSRFISWTGIRCGGRSRAMLGQRYGREVRIDGDLKVDLFRWQPHVAVGGLTIGNPSWLAQQPQGARINQAEIEFRLWPAMFGHLILPLVELDQPDISCWCALADGRTNWDASAGRRLADSADPALPGAMTAMSKSTMRCASSNSSARFPREENAGGQGAAFQLNGDGTLNANKFLADVHGGPLINVDESKPYAFHADIHAGATHAVIDGQVAHPFHLDQFGAAHLRHGAQPVRALLPHRHRAAGDAALPAERHAETRRPFLQPDRSRRHGGEVRPAWLSHGGCVSGPFPTCAAMCRRGCWISTIWARCSAAARLRPRPAITLLPDVALHTERLRQMNGEVDYDADAINSRDFPLRGLATHISIQNGVMRLEAAGFRFHRGKIVGRADDRCPQGRAGDQGGCAHHRHPYRAFHQEQREALVGRGRSARPTERRGQFGAQGGVQRQRHLHRRGAARAE